MTTTKALLSKQQANYNNNTLKRILNIAVSKWKRQVPPIVEELVAEAFVVSFMFIYGVFEKC